jgi:hypothetical protein
VMDVPRLAIRLPGRLFPSDALRPEAGHGHRARDAGEPDDERADDGSPPARAPLSNAPN